MSLYGELKRRNVIRVAVAYLVGAWLLFELAGMALPCCGIPAWGVRFLQIALALGFLPVLAVAWSFVMTPEGVIRDTPVTQSSAKRLDLFIIALVIGALSLFAAGHFWIKAGSAEQTTVALKPTLDTGRSPVQLAANSIAVLPFVNMSDDAANEYFSDGISEELLNLLAKIPELHVPSRSSSFSYKGKDFRVTDAARDLNVRYILEGSVRKSRDQVRITVQLIDALADVHLWSETYDRTLDDIFAIQDEIAGAVVDSLQLTLLGEAPQTEKVSPAAYALYLQARYLNAQGTARAFRSSLNLYQEALAIDPGFARAWRGLAVVYMNQANKGLLPEHESYTLAREAVDKALAINPDYAMAHATHGVLLMTHGGDMAQAAPLFAHALSLDPDNLVLLSYASSLLLRLGRLEETIAIREYDVAKDPLDPIGLNNLSFAYLKAEEADKAIATIQTLLMLAPEYSGARHNLGTAFLLKGNFEAAMQEIRKEPSELWRLIGLAMVHWASGKTTDAEAALAELIEKYSENWAYHIAVLSSYRGEKDRAFKWLDEAVRQKATSLTYIAVEPLFKTLHDDPRWSPFLESIGMSPAQLSAIKFEVALPN